MACTIAVARRGQQRRQRDVKPIYTAVNAAAARVAFEQLAETRGSRYGAVVRLGDNAWDEFIPFLDYAWRSAGCCVRRTQSRA